MKTRQLYGYISDNHNYTVHEVIWVYKATCYIHKILHMYYTIHVWACNYTITYYGYMCANWMAIKLLSM